ncbi:putative RNA-directed DNA polymerase from transposon X-element, partial [Aphis craccivora]
TQQNLKKNNCIKLVLLQINNSPCPLDNTPWYVRNSTLHHAINLPTISTLVTHHYNILFHKNTFNHTNLLICTLLA